MPALSRGFAQHSVALRLHNQSAYCWCRHRPLWMPVYCYLRSVAYRLHNKNVSRMPASSRKKVCSTHVLSMLTSSHRSVFIESRRSLLEDGGGCHCCVMVPPFAIRGVFCAYRPKGEGRERCEELTYEVVVGTTYYYITDGYWFGTILKGRVPV